MAGKEYDAALAQLDDMLVRWPGNPQVHIREAAGRRAQRAERWLNLPSFPVIPSLPR